MKINQNTVNGIIENAKAAQAIYAKLKLNLADNFDKCFHLRPTGDGITVVSTLPFASMRGKNVEANELENFLQKLNNRIKKICSVNFVESANVLQEEFGFTIRDTDKSDLEENIQAAFIKGMLVGQADYEGIEFVASELALMQDYRFDVVGIKEDTLYIFELKKDRTSKVEQVEEYVTLVNTNEKEFQNVLSVYPKLAVSGWKKVQGVMVMAHAVNVRKTIGEKAQDIGVEVWYFEPALHFVDKVRKDK